MGTSKKTQNSRTLWVNPTKHARLSAPPCTHQDSNVVLHQKLMQRHLHNRPMFNHRNKFSGIFARKSFLMNSARREMAGDSGSTGPGTESIDFETKFASNTSFSAANCRVLDQEPHIQRLLPTGSTTSKNFNWPDVLVHCIAVNPHSPSRPARHVHFAAVWGPSISFIVTPK